MSEIFKELAAELKGKLIGELTGMLDSARNQKDALYYKVGAKAGLCVGTLSDVEEYLEKGESYAKYAYNTAEFVGQNAALAEQLRKGAEGLGGLRKGVSKAKKVCGDVKAASNIGSAILVLNAWQDGKVGQKEAAKAFDLLFSGAGRFASKLPPPLNAYGDLLSGIGVAKFFTGMQDKMDPESPNTPRGRALREAMQAH